MPLKTLKKRHLDKIKADMDNQDQMLNDAEVNAIAVKINNVINLPFLGEEAELIVFAKLVRLVDKKLYLFLPNEYYTMVKDVSDGISPEEVEKIEERLTPIINSKINIPILNEKMEAKVIGLILGIILNAMVKGLKLEERDPD